MGLYVHERGLNRAVSADVGDKVWMCSDHLSPLTPLELLLVSYLSTARGMLAHIILVFSYADYASYDF